MSGSENLKAATNPCVSCPYRRDVPSGLWAREEYDKLPRYDGETWEQSRALFFCHQQDGNLCAGWLACHKPHRLLALRLHRNVDASVYSFTTDTPVFRTGAAARRHGIKDIARPGAEALRMIEILSRKAARRGG